MDTVVDVLALRPRRKIVACLAEIELSDGEIAERFDMTKPSLSKQWRILESEGLIASDKSG